MAYASILDVIAEDARTVDKVRELLSTFQPDGLEIIETGARCYGNLLWLLNRVSFPQQQVSTPGGPLPLSDMIVLPVLIAQRAYRWAASDLLRGRSTSAYTYLRQQIEAGALAKLFLDTPSLSGDWFAALTHGGQAFFKKSQPTVKNILRSWKLAEAYDRGSTESVHVRMGPVYRSYQFEPTKREGVPGQYLTLRDTDFSSATIGTFLHDLVYLQQHHLMLMHHVCTSLVPTRPLIGTMESSPMAQRSRGSQHKPRRASR